jgi:hypothetical protein
MAFIIYEDTIRKIDEQKDDLMDIDVDKLYKEHLNEETKIELDSFVFDRHTGATTSRSDFALEGARVVNECNELFIDKYREMYNEFKIMIDNEEEEKKQKKKTKQIKRKVKDPEEEKPITLKKLKVRKTNILYKLNLKFYFLVKYR